MFVKGNMKWQTEYSVSGIGSVSNFSIVNTLTPAPDPVSFCSPPCVGQEGVHPQNRSWRHHPCQNHSNFTTHGLCEHNTGARWKTAPRTNSVTAWAIWDECSRLILLIRTFTPAWFGFPSYQTRHTRTRRISLINWKCFTSDSYVSRVHLTKIQSPKNGKQKNWKIKDGCGSDRRQSGEGKIWKKKSESNTEGAKTCVPV